VKGINRKYRRCKDALHHQLPHQRAGAMMDETGQRLARLEGKMESVVEVVQRIENGLQRVIGPLDRGLAELTIQFQHLQEKVSDTREQTVACAEAHKASSKQLDERIQDVHDKHAALENKTTGGLRVAMWICGGVSAAMFAAGSWVVVQVGKNAELNAVHQQRIEQLEKQVAEARDEARAGRK
jgi:hypothetical protein